MQKCNENAANRYSYVGEVYNVGESKRKEEILNSLPAEWSDLHKKGYIHIHDLDAYGLTYGDKSCIKRRRKRKYVFKAKICKSGDRKWQTNQHNNV